MLGQEASPGWQPQDWPLWRPAGKGPALGGAGWGAPARGIRGGLLRREILLLRTTALGGSYRIAPGAPCCP